MRIIQRLSATYPGRLARPRAHPAAPARLQRQRRGERRVQQGHGALGERSGGQVRVRRVPAHQGAHRNLSDYMPLSQAASGGHTNVMRLLLANGAEINSRINSNLGISPLTLAAMNGHT